MNTELIRLSRKAAKEFISTDGYLQAGQLINALCDELEATAPAEPLEPKEQAYRSIAKHVFRGLQNSNGKKTLLLLADDLSEAEKLAMIAFGTSNVNVRRVIPTEDPQVYEV